MSVTTGKELLEHYGHDVVVMYYGDTDNVVSTTIECITCGTVLVDMMDDAPDNQPESTVSKVLGGGGVEMFPPGNRHHLELVFSKQLKWEPWRLQLALDLTELGFAHFTINGFGETVARAKVNVHDRDVVISYVPARGQIAIYKDGDNVPLLVNDNITYDVEGDGWLYDTAHRLVGDLLLWREDRKVANG